MNYYIKSKKLQLITVLSFIITTAICQQKKESSENNSILVAEWAGSYGGTPAFDKMNIEDIKPALEKGMAEKLKEIDAITNNSGAPTFENTIVPLEKSGETLDRVFKSKVDVIYQNRSVTSTEIEPSGRDIKLRVYRKDNSWFIGPERK